MNEAQGEANHKLVKVRVWQSTVMGDPTMRDGPDSQCTARLQLDPLATRVRCDLKAAHCSNWHRCDTLKVEWRETDSELLSFAKELHKRVGR